jgi:hypothetical protein
MKNTQKIKSLKLLHKKNLKFWHTICNTIRQLSTKQKETTMNMPKLNMNAIDYNNLSQEEVTILNMIIKKDGSLKAAKPKAKKHDDPDTMGKAQYVWRMVCFTVSPKRQHQCMPVTANFDLPAYDENGKWSCAVSRIMEKKLDKLVDFIVSYIPKTEWHSIHRWGRAFGML